MTPLVVYADGVGHCRSAPDVIAAAAGLTGTPEVLLGWMLEHLPWLDTDEFAGRTMMAGFALTEVVAAGRLSAVSTRLSGIPAVVARARPDVVAVGAVRRGDRLVFGPSVGWAPAAAKAARAVVVEVDEAGYDYGAPEIPGPIVAVVPRPAAIDGSPAVARVADDIDARIGALVVSILPDDPTLQFGPGGIGEGIASAIDRPVSIWSGLVTDAMAELAPRGLLRGRVVAGYAWGGEPIRELARAGGLELAPIEVTHDLTRLSNTRGFVGCNTALQVGLDGSVNIERVNGRTITSIGGHPDFCTGAVRAPDGVSVIALRSTDRKGNSTIVPVVETVSTPRCDVSVIVTEHGVADLRGVGDEKRAERIIAVAAPEHRDALAVAHRAGLR